MPDKSPLLRRISRVRKRAALTGTAFDFIRVEVPCGKCGKAGLQPLAELAVNDNAECRYCGETIDLSDAVAKADIARLATEYQAISKL
jgi:hypothetical protein